MCYFNHEYNIHLHKNWRQPAKTIAVTKYHWMYFLDGVRFMSWTTCIIKCCSKHYHEHIDRTKKSNNLKFNLLRSH